MDTSANYKDRALASLNGKWEKGILATLIFSIIAYLPSMPTAFVAQSGFSLSSILSLIIYFILLPLIWGFVVYFLFIVREEFLGYERLFEGYKDWQRIGLTKLLQGIYIGLWSLLLVIPGIIKGYSYAMTDYILRDEPSAIGNDAIEKSMAMMEGHKMELFMLHLSFIGWAILSVITCGIGFLFLGPYVATAQAHFYEDLKAEFNPQTI